MFSKFFYAKNKVGQKQDKKQKKSFHDLWKLFL